MNTEGNKKKIIMLFIALGLILSVIFGVTFSYLAPSINNVESNSTVVFNAGTIAINYENGQNQINASEVLPGWTSIKEFSLTAMNNTTISTAGAMNYALKLIVEKNTFSDGAITYSIEGENVDNNGTVAYVLPNSLKNGASEVILGYGLFDTSSDISKGVTHRYTLTMAFPNKTYENQNEDSGKTLSAHIIIANEGESTFSNLTIIDDNNNLNKTMILKNNTAYELPNIASKTGAYFLGWNVESGNATINGNKITMNGDASIKASYSSTIKTEFAYTGKEQIFTAPVAGTYKLEVWGAQGGGTTTYQGGTGAYSTGTIYLERGSKLYINVGGSGTIKASASSSISYLTGGYNGGGNSTVGGDPNGYAAYGGSGGGATHVAKISGLLSTLENNKDDIIIVAAGGGGADINSYSSSLSHSGTNGSGISSYTTAGEKNSCTIATQTTGYSFGQGGNYTSKTHGAGGGGGGFYGGGGGGMNGPGCGGSSYIGNSLLKNKSMYCYNCTESSAETTKTISTTCHSSTPTENCAKEGNGYAKITMPEIKERRDLSTITVVSEELKKVITIEAEKGEETEISVEGLTNSSLGFKSFEIEKGEATINKTKITPLSDTIVVRIIYEQIVNWEFSYTGEEQIFTAPVDGIYKIKLWGASPNNDYNSYTKANAAYGGYTAGNLELKQGDTLYVYVGGSGTTFNCCTSQGLQTKSGGATDVRLINGEWNDAASLSSRIMVAGGGGTSYADGSAQGGSNAGGLSSYKATVGNSWISYPSDQTSSGTATSGTKGGFGYGGVKGQDNYSSGAGGYWGGSAGPGGAGGSSFISGHTGCVAISSQTSTAPRTGTNGASCTTGTTDNLCSVHYSNKIFTDTVMIDGAGKSWTNVVGGLQLMPNYSGGTNVSGKGNSGNGYARITLIS